VRKIFRLGRTIKYLRWKQIFYRLYYLCQAKIPGQPSVALPTPEGVSLNDVHLQALFCSYPFFASQEINQNQFTFLNKTANFETINWAVPDKDRLWRYNLHYFQYLHPKDGLSLATGLALIEDWIAHNPPGTPDAWDPFPTSLRLVNWFKFFWSADTAKDVPLPTLQSAYHQTLWLEKHLEFHLLGNHLFKNIKPLIFAGLFFAGKDGKRWLKKGLTLLNTELTEQILADGGHFERSPMYHAMILEDCLDLYNILAGNEAFGDIAKRLKEKSQQMLGFLQGMIHPDGDIALFNDAALGIEQSYADLSSYFTRLTGEIIPERIGAQWDFPASGYYIMAPVVGNRMIIDCGNIGPDYLPGHAHCDMLSFELSLHGKKVIVDSGCCQYIDSEIRAYNRGNLGHNTIMIDGKNQSEVWGAHRCARRAKPANIAFTKLPDGSLSFSGSHDGYSRLAGRPVHSREINWNQETISIIDRVHGSGRHRLESRLHIHPDYQVSIEKDGAVVRDSEKEIMRVKAIDNSAKVSLSTGWYCPEFGKKIPCPVLLLGTSQMSLPIKMGWLIHTF